MVDEKCESFQPNLTRSDMLMSVQMGSQPAHGVVQMEYFQIFQSHLGIEMGKHGFPSPPVPKVITGCKGMAGIQTNSYPFLGIHSPEQAA